VCAVCCDGSDVIRLVENALNVDFNGTVECLSGVQATGEPADGPDVMGSGPGTRSCRVFSRCMLPDTVDVEATS
jgi:hypothetical protein